MLESATTVIVGGRRLRLSRHAVERYVERVKPMFDYGGARLELAALLRGCELGGEQPAWAVGRRDDPCGWIVPTDGIAFPVVDNEIVTCLTRAEVGAELRVVRSQERRDRVARQARPGRKKKNGKVARDERRRTRAMRDAADG